MDKIAAKATEITAHTDNTMADQKMCIFCPMYRSTKHSMATDKIATSMKKYKADATKEEDA